MRLYDEIRRKWGEPKWAEISGHFAGAWREGEKPLTIKNVQVIAADNVTEYFYAQNPKEVWSVKDFPNIAPPFPAYWIETKRPSCILSEQFGRTEWNPERPTRWGALFFSRPVAKDEFPDAKVSTWKASTVLDEEARRYQSDTYMAAGAASVTGGWIINVALVMEVDGIIDLVWQWVIVVDDKGRLVPKPLSAGINGQSESWSWATVPEGIIARAIGKLFAIGVEKRLPIKETQELAHEIATEMVNYVKPLLLAVSLMHCRNVERIDNMPPPKLNRKHVSRGRPPLCRYYTLRIQPVMRSAVVKGEKTGIEQSFHIVRGHFKTYTPEKPLLGRVSGMFWWDMHTAGSKRKGVVAKDYEVER